MAREEFYRIRGNHPLALGTILGASQDIVNFTGTGDQTLVTAVAERKIHLLKLLLVGAGASNMRFWSGASVDAASLSGQMNFMGVLPSLC